VQENIDELLKQHAEAIAALRCSLGHDLPATWDELWLLRFVLSFEDISKRGALLTPELTAVLRPVVDPCTNDPQPAVEACKICIAYRAKNADMLRKAAAGEHLKQHDAVVKCCVVGFHGKTKLDEPLYIVRAGLSSPSEMFKHVTQPEFLEWLMYMRELAFLKCDALTRDKRVLVKQISVVDLAHVTLSMAGETQFQRTLGESSKLSENVYPQLLGKQVIINPPRFFYALFSLFKTFMSPKVLARLGVCPGNGDDANARYTSCPFAGSRFDAHAIPTFVGGDCRCTMYGGCIAGVPNSCKAPPGGGNSADGAEKTVTISAGAYHDVLLAAKTPGCKLLWQLAVADKGVELSAEVQPETGPPVSMLAVRKIRKEDGPATGVLAVPAAGTVRVRLDNSYSRFTGKTCTYTFTLMAAVPADATSTEA